MSEWTKVIVAAVVLTIISVGPASATTFGSDDFNRANATDLGASWRYCSNAGLGTNYWYGEQNDPNFGILGNKAYRIDPPDRTDDMLYGAPSDDGVDDATRLFRAAYVDYEITGLEPSITVEADIINASWGGLILHQAIVYSYNPTFPPPLHPP